MKLKLLRLTILLNQKVDHLIRRRWYVMHCFCDTHHFKHISCFSLHAGSRKDFHIEPNSSCVMGRPIIGLWISRGEGAQHRRPIQKLHLNINICHGRDMLFMEFKNLFQFDVSDICIFCYVKALKMPFLSPKFRPPSKHFCPLPFLVFFTKSCFLMLK